jgi:hypothetical protein
MRVQLLVLLSHAIRLVQCTTHADDVAALCDLYNATGGASWARRGGWDTCDSSLGTASTDPCDDGWYGSWNGISYSIECTGTPCKGFYCIGPNSNTGGTGRRVIELYVLHASIWTTFNLVSQLFLMRALFCTSRLKDNLLTGMIPSSIGDMTSMTRLYVLFCVHVLPISLSLANLKFP